MAKRKVGVQVIATALKCSKAYVSEVLTGAKEDNSELAQKIKAAHKKLPQAKKRMMSELKKATK